MNIEYDPQADALYLSMQPNKSVNKSKELEEGLVVDLDKTKKVIGLEVLNVSKKFKLINYLILVLKGLRNCRLLDLKI